jgi:hypothetical protein
LQKSLIIAHYKTKHFYNTSLTMTKTSKQTSTLDIMPMSPPIGGGRRAPPGLKQYNGTKEEEIETARSK